MKYFKLLRVKHYIKNLLIFFPLVFSGKMTDFDYFIRTFIAFFAFCFACSVIYILNDIRDAEKDRLHPVKKNRPIANGEISNSQAIIIAVFLFGIAAVLGFSAPLGIYGFAVLLLYMCINFSYSFGLKNIALLDVALLSFGFVLRIIYGGVINNIIASNWLYVTVITISLYLSIGKRRGEFILLGGGETRGSLKGYTLSFFNNSMQLCLTLSLVFYSLWCMDKTIADYPGGSYKFLTIPAVLFICLRYWMLIDKKDSLADPVEVLLKDKILIGLVFLYAVMITAIVYFSQVNMFIFG